MTKKVKRKVHYKEKPRYHDFQLSINDWGSGVTEEEVLRVLKPFFQSVIVLPTEIFLDK